MMKSEFFLCVVLFSFENIMSMSVPSHVQDFLDAEEGVDERSSPKTESEGGVIWKRIDKNPHEESFINLEESDSGNDFFMQQPTDLQIANENEDKATTSVKEIALEEQPFFDNSLAKILDGQNTIANGTSLDPFSATSVSVELEPHNLTNAIIIDFSNITGDAIVLDTFSSSDDDLDEVSELSKGEEIAVLHEMPTSSFEFLIDAQTRRNILLKELLGSQTIFVEDNDTEPAILRELEHSLEDIDLHSQGNNSEEIMQNDNSVPVGDKSEVDEMAREDNVDETTTSAEIELRNSSENIVPECPQPGWCIFWFLSQDTCAVNSHCLGSRICCKTGCSKTCVDV